VEGLVLSTKTNNVYSPEFHVAWKRVRLVIQWRRLFIPFYATLHSQAFQWYQRYFYFYSKICCNMERWCCRWEWDPLGISTALNLKPAPRTPKTKKSSRGKQKELHEVTVEEEKEVLVKVIQVMFEEVEFEADKMQYVHALGGKPAKGGATAAELSNGPMGLDKSSKRAWVFGKLGLTDLVWARMKLSIRLFFMKHFEINFSNMSFHVNMPDEGMTTYGKCANLLMFGIHGATKHAHHEGALVGMDIHHGVMTIKQGGLHAVHFEAAHSSLRVDLHLPSKGQDIHMNIGVYDVLKRGRSSSSSSNCSSNR
jgi:hypothetical protein